MCDATGIPALTGSYELWKVIALKEYTKLLLNTYVCHFCNLRLC